MKKIIALLLAVVLCMGLFVGCGKQDEDGTTQSKDLAGDLVKAKEYLYSLLVNAPTETATDLEYPARVKGGNTFFEVEWTVEIISGEGEIKVIPSENEGFIVVDVPAEAAEDINYKLTATIKGDGISESLEYNYTVPQFALTTFEDYAAAEDDTLVIVQGVVTGILSKTNGDAADGLYFQDSDGGYYAYNTTVDPVTAGVEIGMTVRVTGLKDTYNGTYEVVNGEIQIIDSNKTPAEPVDFTEIYLNAPDLKDASLTAQQSMLVTVKGVEITKQNDKYLQFKLGGKETYIYISSSNCPISKEDENTLIATYNEKSGYLANVTGLITLYNGSFYLTPVSVDAFEYLNLIEKSDEEMVDYEIGNLEFPSSVNKDTELELPAVGQTYNQVAIAWAVEGQGAAIVDGKLVLTVAAEDSIITLTATVTIGEVTKTASFDIKIRGNAPSTDSNLTLSDTINNGDKVVIYYPDSQLAISGVANGNKLTGVEAILSGNTLSAPDAAIMDVVVDANGYYTFIYDGKYLTAGETGNSLSWADAASDYSLWTLVAAEGGYYIQNVNAAYNGNPQYVEYYNSFTTYGFNESKTNIYLFQFFVVGEASGNDSIADGSEVKIYYPDSDNYITGTASGNKLAAGTEAEAAVWTLSVDENGYYTFICNGKYLTSGATGNSLTLADAPSEYSLWELVECEGGYYIKNVNAAYNGNAQYLEYYNGFTTYGFNESKANIYTFVLVVQ